MALFITETTSSMADFISKLNTFLTTAGAGNPNWTADLHNAGGGEWAISQAGLTADNDIQVAFQWDTGSVQSLGIYQYNDPAGAGNYDGTRAGPWDQDEDSGNGAASTAQASLILSRHVHITDTPLQYWAFCGESPEVYAYIVVKYAAASYSHFSFGEMTKFNDWTGGAFACGQRHNGGTTSAVATLTGSTALFDGICQDGSGVSPSNGMELFMATVNAEALPQQITNGRYAIVGGNQTDLGLDRQSNDGGASDTARALFVGGFRSNEIARSFGALPITPTAGFIPGYPIDVMYWHQSPSTVYGPMGILPGVRGINIDEFADEQEIVSGSDTWVVFPTRIRSETGIAGTSFHQGMMYKKN